MKTAFSILPPEEQLSGMNLLIEAGWYGISFVWFKKDQLHVHGVLSYNFNDQVSAEDIVSDLDYIFRKEPVFSISTASVIISYNFKESLLVPDEYYKADYNNAMLDEIYGGGTDAFINSDKLNSELKIGDDSIIYNLYRIPYGIKKLLDDNFSAATLLHSTSCQTENRAEPVLKCIVYHNIIKIILTDRRGLLFVQQFNYKSPADVVYHLVNVVTLHEYSTEEIIIELSGMIDEDSSLYQEIYKYFLHVIFCNVSDEVFLSAEIKAFPLHFFSHLTALVKCVS